MVTRIVIDRTLEFLRDMPKKAILKIDGNDVEKSFHSKVIENDTIKIYIYLNEGHGVVTEAKIVDAQNIELDKYTTNIEHSEDGLMIVFTLNVTMKGVVHA